MKYLPVLKVVLGLAVAGLGIYNLFAEKEELVILLMVALGILLSVISIEKRNKDREIK